MGSNTDTRLFWKCKPVAVIAFVGFLCCIGSFAKVKPAERTQFIPDKVWPDNNGVHINAHGGGILFKDGTYYWYGEHKVEGKAGNTAQVGVHVYSSKDIYNWKDGGIALKVSDDPKSDIAKGCILERPKVIYNALTDKYVMWFHLELKGQGYRAARTGVAVADQPAGPFTFIRSLRPNAGVWPLNVDDCDKSSRAYKVLARDFDGGQMARDMTLFVDDDGKAYQIFSSEENLTLHIAELSADFLSHSGRYVQVLPGRKNEAPAICKHDGRYWLITSGLSGWRPNAARSAVADNIFGPWKPLGNPCVGVNPQNNLGPEKTFGGQSTFILPVNGKPGAFIALFDIWRPNNAITGGCIWLPLQFEEGHVKVEWMDEWDLTFLD